jgi:hypothetical protein
MIVAEELCCDWRRVQVLQADLDPKYGEQLTGGSLSVRTSYENLRKAGAAAREMLISTWCRARSHQVVAVSPAFRRSPRLSATVFLRPQANASGGCRFGPPICGPHERVSVDFHPCPELL